MKHTFISKTSQSRPVHLKSSSLFQEKSFSLTVFGHVDHSKGAFQLDNLYVVGNYQNW